MFNSYVELPEGSTGHYWTISFFGGCLQSKSREPAGIGVAVRLQAEGNKLKYDKYRITAHYT